MKLKKSVALSTKLLMVLVLLLHSLFCISQNTTLLLDNFDLLSNSWNDIYLKGKTGGSKNLQNGFLVVQSQGHSEYGVYNSTPLTGNFYTEIEFSEDDAIGLALIKNKGGVPDLTNYTMLTVTNRTGKVYVNQYDNQNGLVNVHDFSNLIPEHRYQVVLDSSVWSVPFVGTNKKIRILHEAISNSFHYYYGTTLVKDGHTSNDWLELAPMYNWLPNSQEYFVALLSRNENKIETKTAKFNYVKVIKTPETDQDDSKTGFQAVKREFNWSGFNGAATVVTFGQEFAFDKNVKLVLWDRANNAPMWRLDNQTMHSWQFGERKNGGYGGCGEAMSDRQLHGQEVEILENNAVRKVIRWKNTPYFPSYHYPGEGSGGTQMPYYEEYWTLYPDGIGTRRFLDCPKLDGSKLGDWPEFLEGMTIEGSASQGGDANANPAFSILDLNNTLNNYHPGKWDSNTLSLKQLLFDAHYKNGLPDVILAYNNSTDYETNDGYPIEEDYANSGISWHNTQLQFAHWPVGREPYGQNTNDWEIKSIGTTKNEVTSNALGSFGRYHLCQDWKSNFKVNAKGRKYRDYVMLVGLLKPNDYETYRDYVQTWLNPGTIEMLNPNCIYIYNNHSQRELSFKNLGTHAKCEFNIKPEKRSIRNPSFRIDSWKGSELISVKLNGKNTNFKSAMVYGSLLIWIETVIGSKTKIEIQDKDLVK